MDEKPENPSPDNADLENMSHNKAAGGNALKDEEAGAASSSSASSAPSELPKEIGFFSGNPSVEVTNGIIHLYKRKYE